jgi:hypothetical protein
LDIEGNEMEKERIIDILEKESEFEKVSATYLFYGDKRVDLIYYAKEFCKLILLKNKQSTEDEEYIMRQINDESHPDIEIINKDNSGIKIDKVREIIYSAIESPYNSSKKIFIINGVEGLRKESANAFLKIIEEPPKDIYFILLTRTLNILPTIKSRAIKFYIPAQTPVSLNVEKETYDFFDGNTEKIEKWKKSNVNINDKKNGSHSSVGRAPALQAGGHWFEPNCDHHFYGGVAQLVRVLACHARCREFESRHFRHKYASIAQSVEQGTENPCVRGSIPRRGTTF